MRDVPLTRASRTRTKGAGFKALPHPSCLAPMKGAGAVCKGGGGWFADSGKSNVASFLPAILLVV